jgi:hypothetical protein
MAREKKKEATAAPRPLSSPVWSLFSLSLSYLSSLSLSTAQDLAAFSSDGCAQVFASFLLRQPYLGPRRLLPPTATPLGPRRFLPPAAAPKSLPPSSSDGRALDVTAFCLHGHALPRCLHAHEPVCGRVRTRQMVYREAPTRRALGSSSRGSLEFRRTGHQQNSARAR